VVYRSIVRIRNAGWDRGIVLLVDPDGIAMVPVAFSIGAADFVLSTASGAETDARLRRASAWKPDDARAPSNADQPGIELHWRTHQMTFEGRAVSLTLRELQLLAALIERSGQVVTAGDLQRVAWGRRKRGGDLAAAYVCSLRKKLAWFGGRFGIQTIRGVGYRFMF
jgi:DNA-binding response OmpR family regulator